MWKDSETNSKDYSTLILSHSLLYGLKYRHAKSANASLVAVPHWIARQGRLLQSGSMGEGKKRGGEDGDQRALINTSPLFFHRRSSLSWLDGLGVFTMPHRAAVCSTILCICLARSLRSLVSISACRLFVGGTHRTFAPRTSWSESDSEQSVALPRCASTCFADWLKAKRAEKRGAEGGARARDVNWPPPLSSPDGGSWKI